jgi:hypothetical protein
MATLLNGLLGFDSKEKPEAADGKTMHFRAGDLDGHVRR